MWLCVHGEGTGQVEMSGWFNVWHDLTPRQGTLRGGAFVLCAGIAAEALRIGRDSEVRKALPPEDRDPILTEKVDSMQRVISELALTGNYQTADFAIA